MEIKKRTREKRRGGEHYSVLILAGKNIMDDISKNPTFSCTNKKTLSENTGIGYHRLVYIFTKLEKKFLIENDNVIIRSNVLFKGKQIGGLRNLKLSRRGNDY